MSFTKIRRSTKPVAEGSLCAEEVIAAEVAGGHRRPPLERIKFLLPGYHQSADGRISMTEYRRLHAYLQRGHNVIDELEDIYAQLTSLKLELTAAQASPSKVEIGGSIVAWLETIKPTYGPQYAAVFAKLGIDDKGDLEDIQEDELLALELELRAIAKPVHFRKISMAVRELLSRPGGLEYTPTCVNSPSSSTDSSFNKHGGNDDSFGSRMHPVLSSMSMQLPLAEPAAESPLPFSRRPSSSRPSLSQAPRPSTGASRGDTTRLSQSLRLPQHAVGEGTSGSSNDGLWSIREWLDEIKLGYGAKFGANFEAVGIEDRQDISNVDNKLARELVTSLWKVPSPDSLPASPDQSHPVTHNCRSAPSRCMSTCCGRRSCSRARASTSQT